MKASKVLLRSNYSIYGVILGQENRLDVTYLHTERFLKNLKNRPTVEVWYRLEPTVQINTLRLTPETSRFAIFLNNKKESSYSVILLDVQVRRSLRLVIHQRRTFVW